MLIRDILHILRYTAWYSIYVISLMDPDMRTKWETKHIPLLTPLPTPPCSTSQRHLPSDTPLGWHLLISKASLIIPALASLTLWSVTLKMRALLHYNPIFSLNYLNVTHIGPRTLAAMVNFRNSASKAKYFYFRQLSRETFPVLYMPLQAHLVVMK